MTAVADNWISGDWEKIAREAWQAPSWREAAIEYHRDRPPTRPRSPADKLTPTPGDIWRAAGQCIRRKVPHDALQTFLRWCDYQGVSQHGPHVPCLNTDHRQACFGEGAVKPLRQRPSFQSNSL